MSEADRRDCEEVARVHAQTTGYPLFVPPSLAKMMREAGIDMTHVRETARCPLR